MLGADIALAKPAGLLRGALYCGGGVAGETLFGRARRAAAHFGGYESGKRGHVETLTAEQPGTQALRFRRDAEQQVLRTDVAVTQRGRRIPGRRYRA